MKEDRLVWGQIGETQRGTHSNSRGCETPDCSYNGLWDGDMSKKAEVALGVGPPGLEYEADDIRIYIKRYILVWECPGCSQRYWMHIGYGSATKIRDTRDRLGI